MTDETPLQPAKQPGYWGNVWKRFRKHPTGMVGLALFFVMLGIAVLTPLVAGRQPIVARHKGAIHLPAVKQILHKIPFAEDLFPLSKPFRFPTFEPKEDLDEENPYVDMSIAELRGEESKLQAQGYEFNKPIFDELLKAGRFEVVGTLEDHALDTPKDNSLLLSFQYDGSTGQMRRIVIPEEEYPAAYALWRKRLLIAQEIRRKTDG